MYKQILTNQNLALKERIKKTILYGSRRRGAERSWKKRHRRVFDLHSSYREKCSTSVESEHHNMWSSFRNRCDMSTLRICKNISNVSDPAMVPEDILVSDIEPTLISDASVHFLSNKSFYNRWAAGGIFPDDIFHRIDGQFFDKNLQPSTYEKLRKKAKRLSYPVVMKPNRDSYGGQGVFIVNSSDELPRLVKAGNDFVLQEYLRQHSWFEEFHPGSLNTIRVYLYRSVKDNSLHILNMAFKMGKGGTLDNISAGGIFSTITKDGLLTGYAVDKYGTVYEQHPDSRCLFNTAIPDYEGLKTTALKVGEQFFPARVTGLDVCLDQNGRWRVVDINTRGHSLRFAQYGGQPFFGRFTEEVIGYCKTNHWALRE